MKSQVASFFRDRKGFPVAGEHVRDADNNIYLVLSVERERFVCGLDDECVRGEVTPATWTDVHLDEHVWTAVVEAAQ